MPLRFPAKCRDGASIAKAPRYLEGCGLANLAISDAHPDGAKWNSVHFSLVAMTYVKDCWMEDVSSFASGADGDFHMQNNGIRVEHSKRVTIQRCSLANPKNRAGGCGYLFEIVASSEVLVKDCQGTNGRHNFIANADVLRTLAPPDARETSAGYIQQWGFGCSGCVFLRCQSAGSRTFPNHEKEPNHKGWLAASEFHHSLAMACLVDSCVLDDGWLAGNRGQWSEGAGHTSTGCVFWNCSGKGQLSSWQYGLGYVIGPTGLSVATTLSDTVENALNAGTAPEDVVEGEGLGKFLEPASLYEAQFSRRIR